MPIHACMHELFLQHVFTVLKHTIQSNHIKEVRNLVWGKTAQPFTDRTHAPSSILSKYKRSDFKILK